MARDPLDQLTIAELDAGSRLLKADLVGAVAGGTVDRWQGLAIVCWLLERRSDPQAKLEPLRQLTPAELTARLGLDVDDDQVDDDDLEADPTDPAPAP